MQENPEEQQDNYLDTNDVSLDIRWSSDMEKDEISSTVLWEYQSAKSINHVPTVHLPPS
jgi:hypothetical protein